MSYPGYHYPHLETNYESSYGKHYDTPQYSSEEPSSVYGSSASKHYGYSSPTDQYATPSADYNQPDYNSSAATAYTHTVNNYVSYSYDQDSTKAGPLTDHYDPSTRSSGTYQQASSSSSQYSNGTNIQESLTPQPVTEYSPYSYQQPEYSVPSSTFGQENQVYSSSHDTTSSGYTYQEDSGYQSGTWTKNDQYNSSYSDAGYYGESDHGASYLQKEELGVQKSSYSQDVQGYGGANILSQSTADYSHSGNIDSSGTPDYASFQDYDKPMNIQSTNKSLDYQGYSSQDNFKWSSDRGSRGGGGRSFRGGRGSSYSVSAKYNDCNNVQGNSAGRVDFQGSYKGGIKEYNSLGSTSQLLGGKDLISSPVLSQKMPSNHNSSGSFFSRGVSESGNKLRFSAQRSSFVSGNQGSQRKSFARPHLRVFDARNKINEAKALNATSNRPIASLSVGSRAKIEATNYKHFGSNKMPEQFKTPSRPQDRLLNEIEAKEMAAKAEASKKTAEELKKAEEARKQVEEEERKKAEEERKKAEEELRKKLAEEAVKAAPPSKPPETPEEIAREEEIQRKIRESVVIINPDCETALMKADPSSDMEMPAELRDLLKTLTTEYLCKLCSVRIVGPHMGTMHYNGKNHLKKLRNFVQTNGRSAGFNMEKLDESEASKDKESEQKAEVVEIMDVDEKKYCKICKVSFSQDSQAAMHYKGKNHAKKLKSLGTANGPEVFECKICCVTVTAQEHLTAHLNGARHKLQIRKLDSNENFRGRGRGMGLRGNVGRRGGRMGLGEDLAMGEWRTATGTENRGQGFRGRSQGRGDFHGRDLQGFKRRGGLMDGGVHRGDFGSPSYTKRPRF